MRSAQWNVQYIQRLLALDPIALWALNDKTDTTAWDASRNWRNGVHANVALGQPGIGDGGTSAGYDGRATTNIFSPSLSAVYNGAETTLVMWAITTDWTDGAERKLFNVNSIVNNDFLFVRKSPFNNRVDAALKSGGVTKIASETPYSPTEFFMLACTVSETNDELILYLDGVEVDSVAGLGIWGAPITAAFIGALNAVTHRWDGCITLCTLFDRALPPATIADLYRIQ